MNLATVTSNNPITKNSRQNFIDENSTFLNEEIGRFCKKPLAKVNGKNSVIIMEGRRLSIESNRKEFDTKFKQFS